MTLLIADVRHAIRRLRLSPGFTIAATLTLAIAIGAIASLFGVVDAILLRGYPYREPERVLAIWQSAEHNPRMPASVANHSPQIPASVPDYVAWRSQNHAFTDLAATRSAEYILSSSHDAARVDGLAVTPSYFPVLGITPELGRPFTPDGDDAAEAAISYGMWRGRFGGAANVIGQPLVLNGTSYTIVGVMPAGLPGGTDVWTRLTFTGDASFDRTRRFLTVFGRLKPGVSPQAAQGTLRLIGERLAAEYPEPTANKSVTVVPLLDQLLGPVRRTLLILMAAAGCVLVIGAVNLANLFLVRYVAREGDLALRTALGATRRRLITELSVEAATLGLPAGLLGLAVAVGGVQVLRLLAPPTLPRLDELGVDARLFAFCAFISLATVFIFGTLPAMRVSRVGLVDALRDGRRATGSAEQYRVQSSLVIIQVALAFTLMIGAALLVGEFNHFRGMDPGFQSHGVLTARIDLPRDRYPTAERQAEFVSRVVQQLNARPGVTAASASDGLPGSGTIQFALTILGDPSAEEGRWPIAYGIRVSPDYFRTMRIALRRGRGVLPTDDAHASKIAVVDEQFARQFLAGRDPIGQRISMGDDDTTEIVGVVASVEQGGFAEPDLPQFYAPMTELPRPFAYIEVRTQGEPDAYAATLKKIVADLDRAVPLSDVQTMSDRFERPFAAVRFATFVAALFALAALLLSLVGIHGVLAYVVRQRQREIGVRIALGASRTRVMGDVLRRTFALTGTGIVLGLAAAWSLTPLLSTLLVSVRPRDPITFLGSVIAFVLAALLAASVPTLRASRIDPVEALRG